MDEEELNKAPTAPEPEAPAEPINEPAVEQPVHEIPVEEPVAKQPVAEAPEPTIEPTPEPAAEEAPAEPVAEQPVPVADVPETPAEPTNPDLITSAETEAPAEQAPAFPAEAEPKQNSKKPLIITLIILLVLALGGAGVWYFLLRDKGAPGTAVQNDVEPAPDLEPIPASKLALSGNGLSDFDLSFLHLENKQDNIIYSPLSIKYALAMLADAANGRSKEQIAAVIGDYQPKAYLNSANRSLANGMFIRTDFSEQVKQSFKDTLESKYYASVILDPFTTPDNANKWVEDKTLGIIKNTFDEMTVNEELDYMLVNALAIDMKWKNQLQCADQYNVDESEIVPCIGYSAYYPHVNYSDYVSHVTNVNAFPKIAFNGQEDISSAKIAATYFKYDVIAENGGEETVRNVVQEKYNEWVEEVKNNPEKHRAAVIDSLNLDSYMKELSENYNKNAISSDFYFLDGDNEKVFAKDLREYDGSTLQYVSIMPKSSSLNAYINNLTAEKATSLIAGLKDISDTNNFKEGVVTKVNGYVPFFKFNFTMDSFMNHLESLGITDVFSIEDADLSNMIIFDTSLPNKPHITAAIHKADIEFTNDGIKAAAVTAFGGMGAAGGEFFNYLWDVPVEEIDLTFDKPFLFLIRDKSTGEVWFTGTVYNPNN